MVFWIAILAGVLFTWLAVRMGFYETWVLLFNLVVAIYVSIFLAPAVARFVPMPGSASWCRKTLATQLIQPEIQAMRNIHLISP